VNAASATRYAVRSRGLREVRCNIFNLDPQRRRAV
jgi:hypothetical protein